jgi:protein-tyrosine phosphatase
MFDLHCHILPAIDDGSIDLEMSLLMLRIAAESGTTGIAATPHVIDGTRQPSWKHIVAECKRLQAEAQSRGIKIAVFPGAEVFMQWDILEHISGPGPYCINGSRYMLVELPAREIPRYTEDFFFMLQTRGIVPILAHAERYPEIIKAPEILLEWIQKGILVQVNAASFTGRFGDKALRTAELLLSNNMIHCIGSDAHDIRHRKPDLSKSIEIIWNIVGEEQGNTIVYGNANLIINDQELQVGEITKITKKRQFSGGLNWLCGFWK